MEFIFALCCIVGPAEINTFERIGTEGFRNFTGSATLLDLSVALPFDLIISMQIFACLGYAHNKFKTGSKMAEFFTTVGIICAAGATIVVLSLGYFCLRRRVCEVCCCCCGEEEVNISESQENSVDIEMVNYNPVHQHVGGGYERVDSGWFHDWSAQDHRTHGSTNDIIRKVFALPPDDPLGQGWKDKSEKRSKSPEIIAIPARMTQPLGEIALSKGTFSGNTTEHFTPIYRQSKLMSVRLSGSPPVSPHYLDSDELRRSHSPQQWVKYAHHVKDVTSPGDTASECPSSPDQTQHNQCKLTSLSSLTSATSAEASTEGVRSPERPQYQHHSQHNPHIFTIHETCSNISNDSLMVDTRVESDKQAGRTKSHANTDQNSTSTGWNRLMGTASPKLQDPTYRGFLHSFKLDYMV